MTLCAFNYYGGKMRLAPEIIEHFPEHDHYVEPFAGSLAVLLNKPTSPIETINDLNSDITNFFSVLRTQPDQLINALSLTPYAREEFELSWIESDDPVERARRFYVRVSMDVAKAGRKSDKSWAKSLTYKRESFKFQPHHFFEKVQGLQEVADRLRMVQIENRSALEVIKKYDTKNTLFYLDPPYLPATRTSANEYKFELDYDQHEEMAEILKSIKGRFVLSGYNDPIMEKWYKDCWTKSFPARQVSMSRGKGRITQEVLWMNFDPAMAIRKQLSIF